jgi:hypothetical protein
MAAGAPRGLLSTGIGTAIETSEKTLVAQMNLTIN